MPQIGHWFIAREDFEELCRISVDRDSITDDYDVLAERIEQFLSEIKRKGGTAVKVYIKPAELLASYFFV